MSSPIKHTSVSHIMFVGDRARIDCRCHGYGINLVEISEDYCELTLHLDASGLDRLIEVCRELQAQMTKWEGDACQT